MFTAMRETRGCMAWWLTRSQTMLYLIRRSYGYIYHLMVLSEPVSEALLPVYNQLSTLKRCLLEVKNSGGVNSARELYPYSMKVCSSDQNSLFEAEEKTPTDLDFFTQLNSIDNMRSDGKFEINGDIPEGQAAVADLLAECFELNYELRIAAESHEEGSVGGSTDLGGGRETPTEA